MEDTRDNYKSLLSGAYQFNTTNPQNKDYVAVVLPMGDGKIGIVIKQKNKDTIKEFNDQYATSQLNDRLVQIFSPLGININNLTQAEIKAGRVGATDFSVARNLGTSLANIVRVANNHEGERAISEEFSHLIIGIFRNEPLIQRSINTLQDHPAYLQQLLGKDYEDTVKFHNNNMELVAEEALGHILQRNLLKEEEEVKTPTPSLFRRLYNWIISKFRGYDEANVEDVLDSVDSAMSTLAKSILEGTRNITQSDIRQSQREVQFNALSDRIDRNIEILRNAAKTEIKKYKIAKGSNSRDFSESRAKEILRFTDKDADTVEGIFRYAKQALNTLRGLEKQFGLVNNMKPKEKFGFLRDVRMYIQSYGSFLQEMQDALNDEKDEDDNMFLRNFVMNGEEVSTEDIIKELNQLSESLNSRFFKVAKPAFIEFLKPFLGDNVVIPFGKDVGKTISVEELMNEAPSDISFMDMWVQSMADSADTVLQLFDSAVKEANGKTRLECIDRFNRIHVWREKVERLGITDFEWAFEKDEDGNKSGNYISEINHAQFQKELREMLSALDEKYGVNPSGEAAQAKIAEKNAWLSTHSFSVFGEPQPDPDIYRSRDYENLSDEQKTVLDEFLTLKDELDKMYPQGKAYLMKAIQIRKNNSERFWEGITSPSTLFSNIKEHIAATFLDREDDDQVFGESTKKGLTDFAGNEFMVLPALYTTRLKNPNEISTDLIGSLMAYTYAAVNYKHLNEIVDAIEVGSAIVSDADKGRKVLKTRGDKRIVEKFEALNTKITNPITLSKSNIESKLEMWKRSHVYQMYMQDEGVWHIPIIDKDVNKGKFVNWILKNSSLARMGFNWLSNIANVGTGVNMQHIEAVGGQFFNVKTLTKATGEFLSHIAEFASEINSRNKKSKIGLFMELMDVRQSFAKNSKRLQTSNWLKRIFGEEIAFLGQDIGDYFLYGRTAIAMALKEQVLLNGEQMSLWDALQVKDYNDSGSIKRLDYDNITDLEGNKFNINKFSKKVSQVNIICFGNYGQEDANAASQVALGRLLQQYRKWMVPAYSKRFRKGHYSVGLGSYEEGYYITMGRYLNELKRGGFQFVAQYQKMKPEEQANIRRAIFELCQFFAVWALANWIEWPDDKNRPWALKLAEYTARREAHELGALAPSPMMLQEIMKTVKSPLPAAQDVHNLLNFAISAVWIPDHFDEVKSGPYKGMTTFQKNFMRAPLYGVAQYKQIDKFTGDLDNSINYLVRPY